MAILTSYGFNIGASGNEFAHKYTPQPYTLNPKSQTLYVQMGAVVEVRPEGVLSRELFNSKVYIARFRATSLQESTEFKVPVNPCPCVR